MACLTPLINGIAYDYTQIILNIAGVVVTGVESISYEETREVTNNFGTSCRPVSRGVGAIDAKASLEISMSEVENIRNNAAGFRSFVQIPMFDIIVTFINPQGVHIHTLKNCQFTNDGTDTKTGDTDIKKSFDLVISNIDFIS